MKYMPAKLASGEVMSTNTTAPIEIAMYARMAPMPNLNCFRVRRTGTGKMSEMSTSSPLNTTFAKWPPYTTIRVNAVS